MQSKPTETTGTTQAHLSETEVKPKLPLQQAGSQLHFISYFTPSNMFCLLFPLPSLKRYLQMGEENGECKRLFFPYLGSGGKGHLHDLAEVLLLQVSKSLSGAFTALRETSGRFCRWDTRAPSRGARRMLRCPPWQPSVPDLHWHEARLAPCRRLLISIRLMLQCPKPHLP